MLTPVSVMGVAASDLSSLPEDTIINRARSLINQVGKEQEALKYMQALVEKCTVSGDDNRQSLRRATEACGVLGQLLFQKELYVEAFKFMALGIRLAQDNGFDEFLPELYKNIGNIYSVYDENGLAIQNWEKALEHAERLGDKETELKTLCNLSGICAAAGYPDKARRYYDKMMRLGKGNPVVTYFGYLAGAMIATSRSDMTEAENGYKKAIAYAISHQFDPKYVAAAYSELAGAFRNAGILDSARYYYEKNREFCSSNNLIYEQRANLKALVDIYSKQGLSDLAGSTRENYYLLQDSLLIIDEYTRLKDNEMLSEMEKSYAQITRLSKEAELKGEQIKRQRTIMFFILAFMLVVMFTASVVWYQKRKLSRAHRHLYLRTAALLDKEKEMDRLLDKYADLRKHVSMARSAGSAVETVGSKPDTATADMDAAAAPGDAGEGKEDVGGCVQLSAEQSEAIMESVMRVMSRPEVFCGNDFTLERLSQLAGHNSRYVSQVINTSQSKNFRTFVNEYRINEASKRLMDHAKYGHLTIRAIGEELGFKSYSNFIDTFRKITGMTPSTYRKIAEQEMQAAV